MGELIKVENGTAVLNAEAVNKIAEFENAMKKLKQAEDQLKKEILGEMEEKNILKIENETMTISYIASTGRETFDSKKFRADNPDLYDEYVTISPVKSSIRIKVK
jgi:regulator of replication initiation timing